MKKSHIILIIVIAVVSAILVSTYTSSVDSTSFGAAKTVQGKNVKIVGKFDKTKGLEYDAAQNANLTIFNVVDSEGNSERVHLNYSKGKPMGLEQSETVTIHGSYAANGTFEANDIQMKCPSKYNENKHELAVGQ